MLNRKQFIRKFAETCGYTYGAADRIIRDVFDFLGTAVYIDGEDVTIQGFGAFKHRTAKATRIRHPVTGEFIPQPEKDFVKFTPSELLKDKKE